MFCLFNCLPACLPVCLSLCALILLDFHLLWLVGRPAFLFAGHPAVHAGQPGPPSLSSYIPSRLGNFTTTPDACFIWNRSNLGPNWEIFVFPVITSASHSLPHCFSLWCTVVGNSFQKSFFMCDNALMRYCASMCFFQRAAHPFCPLKTPSLRNPISSKEHWLELQT